MRRFLRALRRASLIPAVAVAALAIGVGGGALTEHLRGSGGNAPAATPTSPAPSTTPPSTTPPSTTRATRPSPAHPATREESSTSAPAG